MLRLQHEGTRTGEDNSIDKLLGHHFDQMTCLPVKASHTVTSKRNVSTHFRMPMGSKDINDVNPHLSISSPCLRFPPPPPLSHNPLPLFDFSAALIMAPTAFIGWLRKGECPELHISTSQPGIFAAKMLCRIQRGARILLTFQTDAGHVLPWLLGCFWRCSRAPDGA